MRTYKLSRYTFCDHNLIKVDITWVVKRLEIYQSINCLKNKKIYIVIVYLIKGWSPWGWCWPRPFGCVTSVNLKWPNSNELTYQFLNLPVFQIHSPNLRIRSCWLDTASGVVDLAIDHHRRKSHQNYRRPLHDRYKAIRSNQNDQRQHSMARTLSTTFDGRLGSSEYL